MKRPKNVKIKLTPEQVEALKPLHNFLRLSPTPCLFPANLIFTNGGDVIVTIGAVNGQRAVDVTETLTKVLEV